MSEPTPSRATAITLLCVACLTIMVGCVIVPGLPIIAPALGMEAAAGWLVTVPSLGVVLFGPLAAYIIHRYDMYTSLLAGLAAYGVFG
ncbi:MAG: MFS transporter, partial [Oceanospirillaceae bacterium]|nr:MFS transporter [Oceanospirillaceae bacterium]